MYTKLKNNVTGEVDGHFVRRNSDGAVISKNDKGNDYQAYLAWESAQAGPADAEPADAEPVDAEPVDAEHAAE